MAFDQFGKSEHLRRLCAAEAGTVNRIGHPVAIKQFHCINDRQHGKGGIGAAIKGGDQVGDHPLWQQRARRVMDRDKADARAGGNGKPGRHRILAPRAALDNHHPAIPGKITKRLVGLLRAIGSGDDDDGCCCRMVEEGSDGVGQNAAPMQGSELLFPAIAHARAATCGDDDGGKPARGRVFDGLGRHAPVISNGRANVHDNKVYDNPACDHQGHAKRLEVLP